jgi:hypothetical protein
MAATIASSRGRSPAGPLVSDVPGVDSSGLGSEIGSREGGSGPSEPARRPTGGRSTVGVWFQSLLE